MNMIILLRLHVPLGFLDHFFLIHSHFVEIHFDEVIIDILSE